MPQVTATVDAAVTQDRHRYPGVRAFEERDHARFFGRARAIEELLLRVLSVRLLLQFAPSGVGKTSLLNAGLFPRLRHHNLFPVSVRLNQPAESLTDAVRRSLRESARLHGLVDPIIPEQPQGLWDLMAGVQLWSHDLLLLTPVLVFDQFEEVFTLRDEAFRTRFGEEIGALSLGRAPAAPAGATGSGRPSPDVKVILSLREEYLGKLETFSTSIPDLFHERLRLAPLTSREARDAIVEPAKLPGDHWMSPAFSFDAACLDALIDFIDGASETAKVIESLTLQLVCQRAEALANARAAVVANPRLTFEDFGGVPGLERLVEDFYRNELQKLPGSRPQKRARQMFEQGLLDPAGKRLMLEEGQITHRYGLDAAALDALVESRLLRREPRDESVFYEISHDRLTDAIVKHRRTPLPRWVMPTIALGALFIGIMIVGAIFYVLVTARAQARVEKALGVLLNEQLVGRLREVGLTDALQHVLLDAQIDQTANSRARALSLRHEGDIAYERGTIAQARGKYGEALQALDDLAKESSGGAADLQAERGRTLKRLGLVAEDAGQITQASQYYRQAAEVWDQVLGARAAAASPQELLDASESLMSLGNIQSRMGEARDADQSHTKALRLALGALGSLLERANSMDTNSRFEQGRAMQIYADAALSLVNVSRNEPEAEAAALLARESLRLRPLSSEARKQVGVATATHGSAALYSVKYSLAPDLFADAARQFGELTRWDPDNLRLRRENAAANLLNPEGSMECGATATCKVSLDRAKLDDALTIARQSTGQFHQLSASDPDNLSLKHDVAWGLEVQARVIAALGRRDDALAMMDEALAIRRQAVPDERDIGGRLAIPVLLRWKAHIVAGTPSEALAILDAALAEVDRLPAALPSVAVTRHWILEAKIPLLEKLQRTADADRLREEQKTLLGRMFDPWEARQTRAKAHNEKGNELIGQGAKLKGAAGLPQFRRALEEYKGAIDEYPFSYDYWDNQRIAYDWIISVEQKQETTLRAALTPAWMARVLSTEENRAKSWKEIYEARRTLIQYLRGRGLTQEVLPLVSQGVLEAEEYDRQTRRSHDALWLLADANAGLGMLRWETKTGGWEEAIRNALSYMEQLAKLEPRKSEHPTWIGSFRRLLGDYLGESNRKDAAAREYGLGVSACQEGLKLATDADTRAKAQECLNDLNAARGQSR